MKFQQLNFPTSLHVRRTLLVCYLNGFVVVVLALDPQRLADGSNTKGLSTLESDINPDPNGTCIEKEPGSSGTRQSDREQMNTEDDRGKQVIIMPHLLLIANDLSMKWSKVSTAQGQ